MARSGNQVRRALVGAFVGFGFVLAATAAPALAGTGTRSGTTVDYDANAAQNNTIGVSVNASGHLLVTDNAGVTAGTGCSLSAVNTLDCGLASSVPSPTSSSAAARTTR